MGWRFWLISLNEAGIFNAKTPSPAVCAEAALADRREFDVPCKRMSIKMTGKPFSGGLSFGLTIHYFTFHTMAIVSENRTEVLPRCGLYSTYTEIFLTSRIGDGIGIAGGLRKKY